MTELYSNYPFPENINHDELMHYIGKGVMYVLRGLGKFLSKNVYSRVAAVRCFGQPA